MTGTGPAASDCWEPTVVRGSLVPDDPEVSVCILVLDDADLAVRCLEALRRHPAVAPTELVVVANGTSEDQLALLSAGDDVVLVVSPVNLGFAGGCNCAATVARGRFLVFLNDDSAIEPGCVDALVRAASAVPGVGAVGARILSPDGTLQEAGSVLWRNGWAAHVGEGLPAGTTAYGIPRDVDYASANAMLVSRAAWDDVGGFDPQFFPAYFEDVDLCLALRANGWRVRYEPAARVVHEGSRSTSATYRRFLLFRNHARLMAKWSEALDRFEPRPEADAGPAFERALRRGVDRAAAGPAVQAPTGVGGRGDGGRSPGPGAAARAAEELQGEYLAYLEQTAADSLARVRQLEEYVDRLWGVRFRRWVSRRLRRDR